MKKIFLFSLLLSLPLVLMAAVGIKDGGKYRIVCQKYATGCLVLGERHDKAPLLFYDTEGAEVPTDAWWVVSKRGGGYTFRNAATGEFMVYKEGKVKNEAGLYTAKGIQLSDAAKDDFAVWMIEPNDKGFATIENAGQTGQFFNLRMDGSFLLGTYVSAGSENGCFQLFDEKGAPAITAGGEEEVRPTDGLWAFADSLRVGGKDLPYDAYNREFFLPLPDTVRESGRLATMVEAKWAGDAEGLSLRICGQVVGNDGRVCLKNIDCEMPATIDVLRNGEEIVASAPLNMTFLPVVEVSAKKCNTDSYVMGRLRVTDPNEDGYDAVMNAGFRYRGASSTMYPKKSFAVKLYDAEGNSLNHEFFGLRNDNNWILDAMYNDGACMRNRVSTDLWNDFATLPYHRRNGWEKKAKTGTRGRFVEVFLNGRYHGLYCMTEKMDRKQLRLKKSVDAKPATETTEAVGDTIHGSLYKSSQWSYEVFMGHDLGSTSYPGRSPRGYNNNLKQETWASYEIKYPDWEKQKIDWGPLWNAVNFVATTDDYVFDEEVKNYFDYPVVRDYFLFIELMLATDNHGKNMFFFNYDQKAQKCAKMIGITPWDLDGTWGIRWDGSKSYTKAAQNFTQFITQYEHGTHTLFYRLFHSSKWNWFNDLKARYAELRTKQFSEESLTNRFLNYGDLFRESGADVREQNRWNGYHTDILGDVDYIKQWIADRLEFLDKQYNYSPVVDGIQTPTTNEAFFTATGGSRCIVIETNKTCNVKIYSLGGQLVRTVSLDQPITKVEGLNAGVYIVGKQKVVVR